MEKEAITGNVHQKLFSKELEGIGGVPICKTCKYRTWNYRCKKQRDIITGKPYSCEACRALKDAFICGIEGNLYEEKPKKKRRLSNSFVFTVMHVIVFGLVFLLGSSFIVGFVAVLLLELSGLFMFVDRILNEDEESKEK